jgi:autotransporter-associated beta strand protein
MQDAVGNSFHGKSAMMKTGRNLLVAMAVASVSVCFSSNAKAVTRVWNKTGSGTLSFTDVANWDDGSTSFPNGAGDIASMETLDQTANQTITLNQPITLGELRFGDSVGGTGLSFTKNFNNSGGAGALVFQNTSGPAKIFYGNSNHDLRVSANINVPVTLNSDTELTLDLQSSNSRNLYFNTGSLNGTGNLIINSVTRGTVAFFTDTYNLTNYAGTIKYTSNGANGTFLQLAGNTVTGGARKLNNVTLEMSVASAGGNVCIFDAQDGAVLELGALRGDGLIVPFTNVNPGVLTGTLKTGYLPGTNEYSGVLSSSARFPGSADPAVFNYEKAGASSTQILSGNNTYIGTTTVSGGTLLVNGTHTGGGMYTVNGSSPADYNANGVVDAADYVLWRQSPGAFGGDPDGYNNWRQEFGNSAGKLGGTGTISASVFVNPGGILAPGAGVGTFSVGSADIDGKLSVEYDGTLDTIDKLVVAGDLDISGASLDFDNLTAAALNGGSHIIAAYGSLTGATFASVADLPAGYSLNYNYLGGNQIALVSSGSGLASATGVPEPTALWLLSTVIGGALAVRRRS